MAQQPALQSLPQCLFFTQRKCPQAQPLSHSLSLARTFHPMQKRKKKKKEKKRKSPLGLMTPIDCQLHPLWRVGRAQCTCAGWGCRVSHLRERMTSDGDSSCAGHVWMCAHWTVSLRDILRKTDPFHTFWGLSTALCGAASLVPSAGLPPPSPTRSACVLTPGDPTHRPTEVVSGSTSCHCEPGVHRLTHGCAKPHKGRCCRSRGSVIPGPCLGPEAACPSISAL